MGTLQKIVRTGLGAALLTDQAVRNSVSRRRQDLSNIVSREFTRFLGKISLHEEIRKALEGLVIEVRIKRRNP